MSFTKKSQSLFNDEITLKNLGANYDNTPMINNKISLGSQLQIVILVLFEIISIPYPSNFIFIVCFGIFFILMVFVLFLCFEHFCIYLHIQNERNKIRSSPSLLRGTMLCTMKKADVILLYQF